MGYYVVKCLSASALVFAAGVSARAQSRPAVHREPTAAELMDEIRLLRKELDAQQRRHEAKLRAMQAQIDGLEREHASLAPPGTTPAGGPAAPGETQARGEREADGESAEDELGRLLAGAESAALPGEADTKPTAGPLSLQGAVQSFNPDISINGDFLAAYSNREGGELDDEFLLREVELSFSGAVDPYTRADVFVTLEREEGEFHVDLEEGYITYLGLPYNLQARFGKFRAEFGKVNAIHRHAIPWTDYPFVIKRYFGEEGLSGTGAELSWLVPNPWNQYVSLTYEIVNNDNDSLFAGADSDDFAHLARLKSFYDLSPASTLELGASFGVAPNTSGHGADRSMIEGFDVTYRWKPKEAGLYKSFLWQSEVLFAQTDLVGGQETSWGMYSAAEYQFDRRWKFGARFDNTQLPFSSSLHERGYSAYLTFLQSEFLFWRLEYLFTDRNFPVDGNEDEHQLFLQMNWTLGAHPAHRY